MIPKCKLICPANVIRPMGDFISGFTGLCTGIVAGSALCAFYIALGVFAKSAQSIGIFHVGIAPILSSAAGCIMGTVITIFDVNLYAGVPFAGIFGLFAGIYVGIFIGCLADVVSSIPVIKNYDLSANYIALILIVFVIGKLIGSVIYWISGVF